MVGWGGGGLFDYSVSPGPVFWEFDTEFWVQSLDLDLDHGLDLDLDTGPDLELDNIVFGLILIFILSYSILACYINVGVSPNFPYSTL